MAYTPVVNDVLEIKTYCTTASQNGINVYHFLVSAVGGGGATDQQMADAISTAAAVPYLAWLPPTAKYAGLRFRVLNKTPPPIPVNSLLGAGVGTQAGDLMSTQTAGLLQKNTALAGQAGRGRAFIPFASEASNDLNGRPTAAAQVLMQAIGAVMLVNRVVVVGGATTNVVPVLYNRVDRTTTPIVAYETQSEWATMKKRSQINRNDTLGP